MDSTAALPYCMGLDYPLLAMQLAAYRAARAAGRGDADRLLPAPVAPRYAAGVAYHWLYGDLIALVGELRGGSLGALEAGGRLLDMARRALTSHHLTFEWADPLPTLHVFWRKFLESPLRRRLPVFRPAPRA
jgi:hypothetical protein